MSRDLNLWGANEPPQPSLMQNDALCVQHLTFNVLTAASFQRSYSPPLTDVEDVTPPGSPSPQECSLPPKDLADVRDAVTSACMKVVETSYNCSHPSNLRVHAPQDHQENVKWTGIQRELAAKAESIENIQDLERKLSNFYPGGVKSNLRPYLRLGSSAFVKYVFDSM